MLYLHCGWPKTGTTSIQSALVEHQTDLDEAGLVYPDRWKTKAGPTHRGLPAMLAAWRKSDDAIAEFTHFLAANDDRDILLSAEGLSIWVNDERLEFFVRFLAVAQAVMPVRCIWTIRRFDEWLASQYLQWVSGGYRPAPLAEQSVNFDEPFEFFAGMRRARDELEDTTFVKYDVRGAHNAALLRAFDIEKPLRDSILKSLADSPRRNVGFTQKQAVALINLEALSTRAGVEFDRAQVLEIFRGNDFRFEEDWPYAIVDLATRKTFHKLALATARRVGFEAYVEFFGDAVITGPPSVRVGPDLLTDEDVARLVAQLDLAVTV